MITLNDDLAINADDKCYILGKPYHYTDKTGKDRIVLQSPSYHTTMAHALKTAVDLQMRRKVGDDEVSSLSQYIEELARLQEQFNKVLADNLP